MRPTKETVFQINCSDKIKSQVNSDELIKWSGTIFSQQIELNTLKSFILQLDTDIAINSTLWQKLPTEIKEDKIKTIASDTKAETKDANSFIFKLESKNIITAVEKMGKIAENYKIPRADARGIFSV